MRNGSSGLHGRGKVALVVMAAVAVLVFLAVWGARPSDTRLGSLEVWSAKFPFCHSPENCQFPQILVSGLDDVRGLAYDTDRGILMATADGTMLSYDDKQARTGLYEPDYAPDKPESMDERGIARMGDRLLIAEHGRGRIAALGCCGAFEEFAAAGTGPSGIAVVGNTIYYTDDHPWPAPPDYKAPGSRGTVVRLTQRPDKSWTAEPIGTRLEQVSGIAVNRADDRLYFTESGPREVRWISLKWDRAKCQWVSAGSLGSARTEGTTLPVFLGIAVDSDDRYVFAAGPLSLYVISPRYGMLGRIVFQEPVTGVTYSPPPPGGKASIYMVVGNRLCRIQLEAD